MNVSTPPTPSVPVVKIGDESYPLRAVSGYVFASFRSGLPYLPIRPTNTYPTRTEAVEAAISDMSQDRRALGSSATPDRLVRFVGHRRLISPTDLATDEAIDSLLGALNRTVRSVDRRAGVETNRKTIRISPAIGRQIVGTFAAVALSESEPIVVVDAIEEIMEVRPS